MEKQLENETDRLAEARQDWDVGIEIRPLSHLSLLLQEQPGPALPILEEGDHETRADRYMGHANPSVQARYRHQLEGQLAEDAKRLEAWLAGTAAGKVVALAS